MPREDLKAAVEATITRDTPDFGAIATRSRRRRAVRLTGALLAVAVAWWVAVPAPTPRFEDQVEAFVALVWAE